MKYILLIFVFVAICSSAFAQETVITLRDAVEQAIANNPAIQSATLETSRQMALKKTAFELPKTDVSMMYGQYNSIQKTDNNLTLTQGIPFPTLFGKLNGLNKAMITSAVLKENVSKNELAFQVKQVFNQLLYLKLRHQSLLQQDSLLSDLLKIANLQY
ncbi:MAG: TolC family protein [Cyclobacteriaceae bacterium]|nr:TolC family protein [Cyclobacteriaceae bacterium]